MMRHRMTDDKGIRKDKKQTDNLQQNDDSNCPYFMLNQVESICLLPSISSNQDLIIAETERATIRRRKITDY